MNEKLRKILVLAGSAVLLAGMTNLANADRPVEFSGSSFNPSATNPCSGEPHEITFLFDVSLHEHTNNLVATVARSGFTSDGFVMFAGRETQNLNLSSGVFNGNFVDMWRSDDGQMFQARGVTVIDLDTFDIKVNKFTLRCLGRNT